MVDVLLQHHRQLQVGGLPRHQALQATRSVHHCGDAGGTALAVGARHSPGLHAGHSPALERPQTSGRVQRSTALETPRRSAPPQPA